MALTRFALVVLCACVACTGPELTAPDAFDSDAFDSDAFDSDAFDSRTFDDSSNVSAAFVRPTFAATLGEPNIDRPVVEMGQPLGAAQIAVVLGADVDPEATPILPPRYGLARRARLSRVSAFQTVGVDLALDGDPVLLRDAPIVEGRDLRLRLYVESAVGDLLLARVRWTSAGETTLFVVAKSIASDSVESDADSLFEFNVPAALVNDDATLCAELLEDGGTPFDLPSFARSPSTGGAFELAPVAGRSLRVHVVPMGYDFDGSGRLPDISDEAMDALSARFEAVYPIASVEIDVLAPRRYPAPLAPDSFDDHVAALREVMQWRSDDGAGSDTYYVGLVTPANTLGDYCAGGCYTGIAPLNESNSAFQRASLVVWYGDMTSGWTALHEVGHTHGRSHAPCGDVAGADPLFPFADGSIGTWGFDQRGDTFVAPSAHDFMSYCGDEWISAYTYSALSDRIQSVAAVGSARFEAADTTPHHFVSIEGDVVHWRQVDLAAATSTEATAMLQAVGADARWTVPARRIQFSIDAGFVLVFPVDDAAREYEFEGKRLLVP